MIEIIKAHPYLTVFVIWMALYFVFHTAFKSWNRFLRMLNIRTHGWPPTHCDADGDFKSDEDKDDEECGVSIKSGK